MKTFILFILVFCTVTTKATNYYFSSVSGDDSRTATAAQSPSTPWKTLNKLNSSFNIFKPGDSLLLKKGNVFYGSISIKKSGTLAAPIVIGSYGTGDKPVITSLFNLTNWISKGNGIWEASDPTLGSTVNMVLLNGTEQEMGRYPNSDAANKGYLNFESHAGKTSITDNELNSTINWTGAELVTRPRHWILNRSVITGQAGNKISYTTSSPYDPYDNYGYFIQNSLKTLDKLGEWYYDPATKKLSMYFGSADPVSYNVSVADIDNLIYPGNYSNIVFDNLTVTGANNSAFNLNNGSNITIQNCEILFSGVTGILVHGHKNLRVENCTISNSNNNGIDLEYNVDNAIIKNNKILNTAGIAGMLQNGEGTGLAIYTNGNNNIIESNEIHNTGFIGITFYGNNVIIKNNFIERFCYVKDDGGAIYTHGGITRDLNRKVTANIIINGIGAGAGTDQFDKRSVTGIYMDANSSDVEISDNTVTTCDQGILLQSSENMLVKNNTLFNNVKQLTIIQVAGDNLVRNNTVIQNILFSKSKEQWASYIMSSADDIALFGNFDSNYYARPIDDGINIYNYRQTTSGGVVENLQLQDWKNKYNKDADSKKTAKQISPYAIKQLIGANKFVNGGFTKDIKGISPGSCVVSFTSGALDGGCLQVVPSARGSALYFKVGSITAGKNYILSYTSKGTSPENMAMGASVRQSGPPSQPLTTVQSRPITMSRTENEILFSPSISEPSALVMLKVDGQSIYYLDNIKFYEADAAMTNIDDSLKFEYNATNLARSIPLNGSYVNVKGDVYSNNIILQPFTSAVLIKTGGDIKNAAPAISITSPFAGTGFTSPASVNITAATDTDGSVAKVDFYTGTTFLGTDDTSPYSFIWNNVAAGNYSLTAKATTKDGITVTSEPVNIIVGSTKIAPSVAVTSPLGNTTFTSPAAVTITATAADADGSVARVDFYNGKTLIGSDSSSPYSFTLSNLAAGNYVLTAIASDNEGLTATSGAVSISVVKPVAPVVTIVSPVPGTEFASPATINLDASVTGADTSVASLQFYSGDTLLGTALTKPYLFTWKNVAAGNYSITAKATYKNGLLITSPAINILVKDTGMLVKDTGKVIATPQLAPAVSLSSPSANARFNEPVSISIAADAADADGTIAKVEFYDGAILLTTQTKLPYLWNWQNVPAGNHTITAIATDNAGLSTVSKSVSITVTGNMAPTVSITSPAINALFNDSSTVSISAAAGDADGTVSKVEFYNGNTLLGVDYTSPFSIEWKNVQAGDYALTAKATDNGGNVASSTAITISVTNPNMASIKINPGDNDGTLEKNNDKNIYKNELPSSDIAIGPNPARNILSVFTRKLPKNKKIEMSIFSMSGDLIKKVVSNTSDEVIRINISGLASGIYLMKLQVNNASAYKQFEKH